MQYSIVVTSMDPGGRQPGFKSWLQESSSVTLYKVMNVPGLTFVTHKNEANNSSRVAGLLRRLVSQVLRTVIAHILLLLNTGTRSQLFL